MTIESAAVSIIVWGIVALIVAANLVWVVPVLWHAGKVYFKALLKPAKPEPPPILTHRPVSLRAQATKGFDHSNVARFERRLRDAVARGKAQR